MLLTLLLSDISKYQQKNTMYLYKINANLSFAIIYDHQMVAIYPPVTKVLLLCLPTWWMESPRGVTKWMKTESVLVLPEIVCWYTDACQQKRSIQ